MGGKKRLINITSKNMQKIVPHLWYNSQAEEAVNFYVEVFSNSPHGKNAKVKQVAHYPKSAEAVSGRPGAS